jgi:hypothetical protein
MKYFIGFVAIVLAIIFWGLRKFEAQFEEDVNNKIISSSEESNDLLMEADIQHLPNTVQKYLKYVGAINKPKVRNFRIEFEGEMRDKGKDWFKFKSVQYNFITSPSRQFFMKAKMFGVPVLGYHNYQNVTANMDIRLFGILAVVQAKGDELNMAETVTVFNDLCMFAPAALIDKKIQWETIDELSVKATFVNGSQKISAILLFNELGQLINFISDDRYAVSDMKRYRFSTPINNYKVINNQNIPTYGEAVWHYPDGEFVYGKFNLKKIDYNVNSF